MAATIVSYDVNDVVKTEPSPTLDDESTFDRERHAAYFGVIAIASITSLIGSWFAIYSFLHMTTELDTIRQISALNQTISSPLLFAAIFHAFWYIISVYCVVLHIIGIQESIRMLRKMGWKDLCTIAAMTYVAYMILYNAIFAIVSPVIEQSITTNLEHVMSSGVYLGANFKYAYILGIIYNGVLCVLLHLMKPNSFDPRDHPYALRFIAAMLRNKPIPAMTHPLRVKSNTNREDKDIIENYVVC
ncbi:unnamed protein product [Adineta ricciae]|uniref:Uncharacterized protein n=1 Tax=Adineta ricciae TaxID=249248 RepID=A0A814NGB6_ADIRI|nr:unnamed protein product [Adineta ricciae]CAF1222369.1 unnamed protein product [Adineta ricciae]